MTKGVPFNFQARSVAGESVSGAKLWARTPGTTTARSLYTDENLTVPATNPVVANVDGLVRAYRHPSYTYDLTVTDADATGPGSAAVTYMPTARYRSDTEIVTDIELDLAAIETAAAADADIAVVVANIADVGAVAGNIANVGIVADTINGAGLTTGTGAFVRATSPTLVTPALGTPSSGNLANLKVTRTCATYAEMTGLVTATGLIDNGSYCTHGRAAEEDGGFGFWRYDSGSTATADGGFTCLAIDGGGAGRFFRQFAGTVQAIWGIAANGSTDDTSQLNILFANTAIKRVMLPPGDIRVTTLVIDRSDLTVEGHDSSTVITCTSETADIIVIGDGTNERANIHLRNFDLWASVTKTAGWGIKTQRLARSSMSNVKPSSVTRWAANGNASKLKDGVWFDGFDRVTFEGEVWGCRYNVKANGKASQTWGAELTIGHNASIGGADTYNVWLAGAANVYVLSEVSGGAGRGVQIDMTETAEYNREFFCNGQIDDCDQEGIYVAADSLALLDIQSLWLASCGTVGNGVSGLSIQPCTALFPKILAAGGRYYNNVNDAVTINACDSANFSACSFTNNGGGTNGGRDLYFSNGDANNIVVSGSVFKSTGNGTLGVCVAIAASCDNFNVTANTFSSPGTAPVVNGAGFGATKRVHHNVGYVTENNGSAQVLIGNSNVTVTHGLATTPAIDDILITPIGPQQGTFYYVSNVTSTTFDIELGGTASGANRDFSWRVAVGAA